MLRILIVAFAMFISTLLGYADAQATTGNQIAITTCNDEKTRWMTVYAKELANWKNKQILPAWSYPPLHEGFPDDVLKVEWRWPSITASCDAAGHLTVGFSAFDEWWHTMSGKDTWTRLWLLKFDGHLNPAMGFDPQHPFAGLIAPLHTTVASMGSYDAHIDMKHITNVEVHTIMDNGIR